MPDAAPFPTSPDRLFPQPSRGPTPSRASTVQLIWADPVTGERLRIAVDADPELLQRLHGEGFHVDSEITRTAS